MSVVMSETRRKMILSIAEGDMRTLPILHFFDGFAQREVIFKWLLKNNIKGPKLMEMHSELGHSPLRMAKHVLRKAHADRSDGIKIGRDWNANK